MAHKNPFYFREIPIDGPFCNRIEEHDALVGHARSLANVLLYSPRRFGKTSLIKRVQHTLAKEEAVTIYTHFYGVTSVEDVAARLAKAVFAVTHKRDSLFKKAVRAIKSFQPVLSMKPDEVTLGVQVVRTGGTGFDLLEEVMESLGQFIEEADELVHLALDEFQEITELPEAIKIEGIMRQHIQHHQASYIFIGSRRRILLGMFNEKQRPFFQSAINFELQPLPRQELVEFLCNQFAMANKGCEPAVAGELVDLMRCFPYYTQKLAYLVFNLASKKASQENVREGLRQLLKEETPVFEGILMGLAPQQIALLKALAAEPTTSIYAQEYIQRHRLGSIGGTQASVKKLVKLDLIERDKKRVYSVVDPVFARWLLE